MAIERICELKGQVGAALTMIYICLRGAQATENQLFQDHMEWQREHGHPTWDKVRAWAKTLDFECDLVMPLLERMMKKDDEKNLRQHAESVK